MNKDDQIQIAKNLNEALTLVSVYKTVRGVMNQNVPKEGVIGESVLYFGRVAFTIAISGAVVKRTNAFIDTVFHRTYDLIEEREPNA